MNVRICLVGLLVAVKGTEVQESRMSIWRTVDSRAHIRNARLEQCVASTSPCIHEFSGRGAMHNDTHRINHHRHRVLYKRLQGLKQEGSLNEATLDQVLNRCTAQLTEVEAAIGYFRIVENMFVLCFESQNPAEYRRNLMVVFDHMFATVKGVFLQIKTLLDRTTTLPVEANREYLRSLIVCYYKLLPLATNTSESACYQIQDYLDKQFAFLDNLTQILDVMLREDGLLDSVQISKVLRAKSSIRDLQALQNVHIRELCFRHPSYVIATHVERTFCSYGMPERPNACSPFAALRLATNSYGQIQIACALQETTFDLSGCSPEHSHLGHYYYASTKALLVANLTEEHICFVSIMSSHETHHRFFLIYLKASVCRGTSSYIIRNITGFTLNKTFHEKIEYPLLYNGGAVGLKHPRPFGIFGVALYLDEFNRLSLQMSTFKRSGTASP